MPHIVPDRRRFFTARGNHTTQTHPNNTTRCTCKGNMSTRQHAVGIRYQQSVHTPGTKQKHSETHKDAYSIPHPVPPKITPRARMVPATAPISLLVVMCTVWRENGDGFNKGNESHTDCANTQHNLFRKCFESQLNTDISALKFKMKVYIHIENTGE